VTAHSLNPLLATALLAASLATVVGVARGTPAAVEIRTFQFAPDTLRVPVGARVVWTNSDDIEHTVTSGEPGRRDGRFHAPLASKGARAEVELTAPGTYAYHCDRHQFMRGAIIVTR
jgi:plastocyanin